MGNFEERFLSDNKVSLNSSSKVINVASMWKVAIAILAFAASASFSKPQLGPSPPIGGGNQLNRIIGARQADYSSFPGTDYQAASANIEAYCPMCCTLVYICG